MNTIKSNIKVLVLCCSLVCFCIAGNAQDYYGNGNGGGWRRQQNNNQQPKDKDDKGPEPSGYISINFGFGTPEGSFVATPIYTQNDNGYGNYALPGSVFHLSIGIPIDHSNFGVALMFGSHDNQYDINTFGVNNQVTPLPPTTGQTDYSESSIMGGLYLTYPFGRLSIDGRLMAGALLCSLPEQNYGFVDTQGDQYEVDAQPTNPTSLAFDAGVGIRFMVAEFSRRKLCIMANFDYLYSSVPYNSQEVELYTPYANNPNNTTYETSVPLTGHLPIELFNVTFGIGYQL